MKFNTRLASLLLFCATVIPGSAFAASVHYTMTFTSSGVTPTGSFDYDAIAPSFSNFVIQFNSATFDFTSVANSKTHFFNCQGPTGAAAAFSLLDGSCANQGWAYRAPFTSFFITAVEAQQATGLNVYGFAGSSSPGGTFTIAADSAEAPEPASIGLILLGGLGVFAARRQLAKN